MGEGVTCDLPGKTGIQTDKRLCCPVLAAGCKFNGRKLSSEQLVDQDQSTCYVPGIVLSSGDTKKDKIYTLLPSPMKDRCDVSYLLLFFLIL